MGLLDRVVSAASLPSLHSDKEGGPFREEMGVLEGAPLFLSWVIENWQTEKAALLIYNENTDSFLPVETKGFDVTSKRRMIFERKVILSWLKGSRSFELTDSLLYQDYFSSRETGRSGSLIGLSCQLDQNIFALVIVLLDEDDTRKLNGENLTVLDDRPVMEQLKKALFPDESGKKKKEDRLGQEDLLRRILTEGEGKVLTKLSLDRLIEKAAYLDPLKDRHDCREEVISLFSSFFNERVTLLRDESSQLFILQPAELFPGSALLKKQLLLGLGQLLGSELEEEDLPMELLENPSEEKKVLERFLAP